LIQLHYFFGGFVAVPTGPQPRFTLSKRPPQGGGEGFGVEVGDKLMIKRMLTK